MDKKYSKKEIINALDNSKFESRYKCYDTYLEQNEKRWKYGFRHKYEESLKVEGLRHFAFIKFYINKDGQKIGLLAGKSASRNVILKSDLNFSINPNHGPARQFLKEENLEWCQTEILIIGSLAVDNKDNRTEAYKIEEALKEMFNLFGS